MLEVPDQSHGRLSLADYARFKTASSGGMISVEIRRGAATQVMRRVRLLRCQQEFRHIDLHQCTGREPHLICEAGVCIRGIDTAWLIWDCSCDSLD